MSQDAYLEPRHRFITDALKLPHVSDLSSSSSRMAVVSLTTPPMAASATLSGQTERVGGQVRAGPARVPAQRLVADGLAQEAAGDVASVELGVEGSPHPCGTVPSVHEPVGNQIRVENHERQ